MAYGGTESVIDTLCRGLTAAGHQVLLVATADSTCPVEHASFLLPLRIGVAPRHGTHRRRHAAVRARRGPHTHPRARHRSTLAAHPAGGCGDDEWIAHASRQGWVALTKDAAIARDHADAPARSTLRVVALDNANVTGPEMAQRDRVNLARILRRSRTPGPYVYVISATNIDRNWPKD